MKLSLRTSIWSLLLLGAFFLAAHPELLQLQLRPHVYNAIRDHVREGYADDRSWSITRVAFAPENVPYEKVQNRNRSLRAFFFHDALYVEQHDPREVFLITGNFWTEPDLENIFFVEPMTLLVRAVTAVGGVQVPVALRVRLDIGTIEQTAI